MTNIFLSKALQNLPKKGLQISHLATLYVIENSKSKFPPNNQRYEQRIGVWQSALQENLEITSPVNPARMESNLINLISKTKMIT
jgi:hypothetical protein